MSSTFDSFHNIMSQTSSRQDLRLCAGQKSFGLRKALSSLSFDFSSNIGTWWYSDNRSNSFDIYKKHDKVPKKMHRNIRNWLSAHQQAEGGSGPKAAKDSKDANAAMASPAEVKQKWRKEQIDNQRKMVLAIDSTWRIAQIQCAWCGWLSKRSRALCSQWQPRWFELRRELDPRTRAVLQYQGSDGALKRLSIVAARRDGRCEETGWAQISVAVSERLHRVLLSASSAHIVDALLSRIASIVKDGDSRWC